MNILANIIFFIIVVVFLQGIRFFLINQSRPGLFSIFPQLFGQSILWLYRVGVADLFLLAITIVFRHIRFPNLEENILFNVVALFSFRIFCKRNIEYQKSVWFSIGVGIQFAILMLLSFMVNIIVGNQISLQSIWMVLPWFIFDFSISFLTNK